MNSPDRKSFTTDWAPKPSARPPIPAPAISGARSMLSCPSTSRVATPQTAAPTMLRRTRPMVSARASARFRAVSSMRCRPGPRSRNWLSALLSDGLAIARVKRITVRCNSRVTSQAASRMSAMRIGRSRIHSAATAQNSLSVHSKTRLQVNVGSRPHASVNGSVASWPNTLVMAETVRRVTERLVDQPSCCMYRLFDSFSWHAPVSHRKSSATAGSQP